MVKVYLLGFKTPYSVLGTPVFEDERFFVVQNNGFKRKIPWMNILYIEELPIENEVPSNNDKESILKNMIAEATKRKQQKQQHVKEPEEPKQEVQIPVQSDQMVEAVIELVGVRNDMIVIQVPSNVLDGTYNPILAKEIFNNANVRLKLGDALISGVPSVNNNKITFKTISSTEIKEKLDMASTMMNTVVSAASNSNKYGKLPSLAVNDQFAMYSSPFKQAVKFSD